MEFDRIIACRQEKEYIPLTFHDILFSNLPHRSEDCLIIHSHMGDELITLTLEELRRITSILSVRLMNKGIRGGDTILLASFSCTNELANVLVFAAAASMGVRIFIPIFPEPSEFDSWRSKTGFSCVIIPQAETLKLKDHSREKAVVEELTTKCSDYGINFIDPVHDLEIIRLLNDTLSCENTGSLNVHSLSSEADMVIFTTSGTSGKSKLLVYSHKSFSSCCQAWQEAGLFDPCLFGNTGFSPLFTHTIGIRTFINCLWSGNPFCIFTTDWFLTKPQVIRYFLLNTSPGHIIGGPAFFNTMLELFREYPELKTHLQKSMKAAISIGAPFDKVTSSKFRSASGVSLMNGFGTTETLMVSLNRSSEIDPCCLGSLLPGVTFGLKKTGEEDLYELAIKSVFQSVRTIGEEIEKEYFETGDLVRVDQDSGELRFGGRRSADFMKDEYGVKIPVSALKEYYARLYETGWIEWFPLINMPGLSALVFKASKENGPGQKELAAMLKSVNDELKQSIEPFEFDHRHLVRFALIEDAAPLTRKGTVSKDQILKKYGQLISDLRNPFVYNRSVETIGTTSQSNLFKFSNPYLSELLEALKMDRTYTRAEGDFLYYEEGSLLQKVTDFTGGFGAGLLGHNHETVRNDIIRFLQSGAPALNTQGSNYYYPSLLARELNRIFSEKTGKYFKVLFGNSGTEATEIAIHHAYLEWKSGIEKLRDEQYQLYGSIAGLPVAQIWDRNMKIIDGLTPCIIVEKDCFHGYSSGARSLLDHKKHRTRFEGLLRPFPIQVDDSSGSWKDELQKIIAEKQAELEFIRMEEGKYFRVPVKISIIIASIIEPVRGEGGIRPVNPEFTEFLSLQKFPLIADEIQCGLGRTGSFPAYKKASYYLLGKSLGGGFEKISAVLIDDERFKTVFTKYYNSTFANGELAAAAALSVLKVIEEENIPEKAASKGEKILSVLGKIAEKYPDVISKIDGSGLMTGIHLNKKLRDKNVILRILIDHDLLGYFLSAWLLNNHNIRVLPSLSAPNSLRLEPSYLISGSEIERFGIALDELCRICREKRLYNLVKFLMNGDPYTDKKNPVFDGSFPQEEEKPMPGSVTAGFIGNFTISYRELQLIEPDLSQASDTGLRILFDKLQVLLQGKPVRIMVKNLLQGKVNFIFYILPFDTSHLEVISRWGRKRFYIRRIQEAADKLVSEGAACISLGAHTSIISGNGLMLAEREGCRILTGNSLTAGSCVFHLDRYLKNLSGSNLPLTIAVVGAGGNIGSGISECLMDQCDSGCNIILAGNNEKRLQKLKSEMSGRGFNASSTTDLFELKKAGVIIICVNTNDPIVFRHHLNQTEPVFIIDISVPRAVSEDVREMKNVVFCDEASSVRINDSINLSISSHTPAGKVFCCAGETILYALHSPELPLKGHIHHQSVKELIPLALKEGFFE